MALTQAQKAELAYKAIFGVGTTELNKLVTEEAYLGAIRTYASDIWSQDSLIPSTAPGMTDGVLELIEDLELNPVPGVSGAYYHLSLKDAIPPGWDSVGGSYAWSFKDGDDNNALIEVQSKDIAFIPGFSTIVLFGGDLSTPNLKVTFYKYVGTKGVEAAGSDSLPQQVLISGDNYITIGESLIDTYIEFRYRLIRSGSVATGSIEIINTAIDDSSSDDSSLYNEELVINEFSGRTIVGQDSDVAEPAVVFDCDFSGSNIRLKITVDAGESAVIDIFKIKKLN